MDTLQQMVADIQIEQAEMGELPTDNWDDYPWTDQIRYVPTDLEEEEALSFFNAHPIEAFEAWVEGLDDRSFNDVCRALRTLRSAIIRYHAEKSDHDPHVSMEIVISDLDGN